MVVYALEGEGCSPLLTEKLPTDNNLLKGDISYYKVVLVKSLIFDYVNSSHEIHSLLNTVPAGKSGDTSYTSVKAAVLLLGALN